MAIANRYTLTIFSALLIFSGVQSAGATTLNQTVLNVVDTNLDPQIFEASLSADEQDVNINGTTVHALIYKDDNRDGGYPLVEPTGIPIPQIVVNVGDEVIVKLTNNIAPGCVAIACDSSIHWHGIELDNDSDGTGVTQNHLTAGQTYTYRFITHRPGVFWFHTHMLPGPQTFAGMYGAFIVKDPNEATLQGDAKIPSVANTHTVVLSDIEYDADGDVGFLDANMPPQAIPWATLQEDCANNGTSCQKVVSGETVLVNGQKPTATTPMITAKSGAGIRLRLINTATNRYFRLKVTGSVDNNLYRIGGEGGFLEQVRLEGGTLGTWVTKYDEGEILVPASGRSDVVVVPTGNNGDIITITGLDYMRGGPPGNDDTAGTLLYIEIDNNLPDTPFAIAEGNDVLGAGGVDDLKGLVISDFYSDPTVVFDSNPGAGHGSADSQIRLGNTPTNTAGQLGIDEVQGHFEDSGPDFSMVPYQDATRYAKTGDTLEFMISNFTGGGGGSGQHHPFHHHGFSFQPVRIIEIGDLVNKENTALDTVLYEFNYNEFVDVIDIFSGQRVVVRMRLDDRPRITDNRQEVGAPVPNQHFDSGGAKGRWVFHCHLFLHATIGMISELVVLDPVADLSMAKADSPDPVAASGTLMYTLTAKNDGPDTAKNVQVTDTLPSGVSYVSDDSGCAHTAGIVTCEIAELMPTEAKEIKITVQVDADLVDATGSATITNDATVTSLIASDPDTNNNSVLEDTQVLPGCAGVLATIAGTPGMDNIVGTAGDDVIATLAGNDNITGRDGNDKICGGSGNDNIAGGPGFDTIDGGSGNDNCAGENVTACNP